MLILVVFLPYRGSFWKGRGGTTFLAESVGPLLVLTYDQLWRGGGGEGEKQEWKERERLREEKSEEGDREECEKRRR
jgi:hypothetical protein